MGDQQSPRRVVVRGSSGSGKTTLARRIATLLDVHHVELDAIHHQQDWQPRPREEFRAAVREAAPAEGRWVACGNYSAVADILVDRADTVVFLDLPRWLVMRRLVWRTVRRAITREELWNGNREPWSNFTTLDPERNVVVWSWIHHERYRERFRALRDDPTHAHLTFHLLQAPAAVEAFMAGLARTVRSD